MTQQKTIAIYSSRTNPKTSFCAGISLIWGIREGHGGERFEYSLADQKEGEPVAKFCVAIGPDCWVGKMCEVHLTGLEKVPPEIVLLAETLLDQERDRQHDGHEYRNYATA